MKYFFTLLFSFLLFGTYISDSFAAIDLNVSPIRYEIDTSTGATVVRTAKLINSSNNTYNISTSASDFESRDTNGTPTFVRRSELVYPDQELSSWITIDTPTFTIGPKETKEISFNIDVPVNATPGWHYGAIFFKNDTFNNTWNIGIQLDYGVIILVNVDGEIISEWEMQPITISSNSGWWGWWSWESGVAEIPPQNNSEEVIENDTPDETDFDITFEIPFENKWNIHLKPTGKIILKDEDGNELKSIWKEVITNDKWVIIWEKIVDYLPINDGGWNVLPSTTRNFEPAWKWFPYKDYDEDGNQIVRYWDPSTYYTKKNVEERGFLLPWEQVKERNQNKTITALVDLAYETHEWENIEFNSAEEFKVSYTEKYIWLNKKVLWIMGAVIFIIATSYLVILNNRVPCIKCWRRIGRHMKACQHCGKKQKKKKAE